MEPVRIEMFGGLRVTVGDRVISRFNTRKTAALLAYLAFYRDRHHPRDVLVDLFWGDAEPEAGRKSLTVALSSLRRDLGEIGSEADASHAVVRADRFSVGLDPTRVETDVQEFEELLHSRGPNRLANLRRAVELCRGPFLPGHYDEWVPRESERLGGSLMAALLELVRECHAAGDNAEAMAHARQAVEVNPLHEEAHREVMRLLAAEGRRSEAMRQYRQLEQVLERDLGAQPSRASRELYESLSTAEPEPAIRKPPPPPEAAPTQRGPELPGSWTLFVGRARELEQLEGILTPISGPPRARLVTLTGPGGCGKSRLALEAARRMQSAYFQRIWWVGLADLVEPAAVMDRIAQLMCGELSHSETPLQQVARHVRGAPAVLVLDNFEHLAVECGGPVRELLQAAADLRIVVTSRQRLNLTAEREFPVPPLGIPDAGDLSRLLECESVQLFVDRARAVRPQFQVTSENSAAVQALCERLEGIPLALELAAARAHVLSPTQMLDQLEQRFEFLVSRQKDSDSRHRSLEAAIDWSFQLLSPELQDLFVRLATFQGGWTLEAACEVASWGEPDPSGEILEGLTQLRENSLVVAEDYDGEMRYGMLEMLRDFARTRIDCGETRLIHLRHAAWCVGLVNGMLAHLHDNMRGKLRRLEREHANLLLAVRRCLEMAREGPAAAEEPTALALRLVGSLGWFWTMRGHTRRIWPLVEEVLQLPGVERHSRWLAYALNTGGSLCLHLGMDERAGSLMHRAEEIGRQLSDERVRSHALSGLAHLASERGDYPEATALWEASLEVKRASGDPMGVSGALINLGTIAAIQGDRIAARRRYLEGMEFSQQRGDQRCYAAALNGLGEIAFQDGDLTSARRYHAEALEVLRRLESRSGLAVALDLMAEVAIADRDFAAADRLLEESLQLCREVDDRRGIFLALVVLARLELRRGNGDKARSLFGQSLESAHPIPEPTRLIEVLCGLRSIAVADGDYERAGILCGATEELCRSIGAVLPPDESRLRATDFQAMLTHLGEARLTELREEGAKLIRPEANGSRERLIQFALSARRQLAKS